MIRPQFQNVAPRQIGVNPASQPPGIGDLAGQQLPYTPGPPRDDADFQQRQAGWQEFFQKPETIAGLMKFAQMVTAAPQPGQSNVNQVISAAGGGLAAGAAVDVARRQRERADAAEAREDRSLDLESRRVDTLESEQGRRELERQDTTRAGDLDRAQGDRALEIEGTRVNDLGAYRRAEAEALAAAPGQADLDRQNRLDVAGIQAAASITAAQARARKKDPDDITMEEFLFGYVEQRAALAGEFGVVPELDAIRLDGYYQALHNPKLRDRARKVILSGMSDDELLGFFDNAPALRALQIKGLRQDELREEIRQRGLPQPLEPAQGGGNAAARAGPPSSQAVPSPAQGPASSAGRAQQPRPSAPAAAAQARPGRGGVGAAVTTSPLTLAPPQNRRNQRGQGAGTQ